MNDFERILTTLRSAEVSFIIIGGVAATVHGSARLTSDIDVVYERSRPNIERLVDALSPLNPYLRGAPPGLPSWSSFVMRRNESADPEFSERSRPSARGTRHKAGGKEWRLL